WNNNVPAGFSVANPPGLYAGGYPPESYNYGPNHFVRLLEYVMMVRSAMSVDLLANTDYGQRMARSLIYNLKANRWETNTEGTFSGDVSGVMPGNLAFWLSRILAGTQEGSWMTFYYQLLNRSPLKSAVQNVTDYEMLILGTNAG